MTEQRKPDPGPAGSVADTAGERAGRRLGLGLLGAVLVLAAAVPLGVLVRSAYPPLVDGDLAVSRGAERLVGGSDALLSTAQWVTYLGDPFLVTAAVAVLALVLARTGHRRLALYVVVARLGALALSSTLKLAIDRARPVFDEPVATALGASFPSGHALGSAAFYATAAVVLLPYVRRGGLLLATAVLISALVAASRVLLGVHYLSDVSAGLVIGLGWAALCTAVFAVWRREEGGPVDPIQDGIGR